MVDEVALSLGSAGSLELTMNTAASADVTELRGLLRSDPTHGFKFLDYNDNIYLRSSVGGSTNRLLKGGSKFNSIVCPMQIGGQ